MPKGRPEARPLALVYAVLFFRQGVGRAIRSCDVIAQALIMGVVESRFINKERATENTDISLTRPTAVVERVRVI
ncbi:hypothetical protein [Spongiactinospora sp. TRM90649]|uniref:hypothetical protein n=1 Tax=Spongiactinospora sp. TRM90649 TaxID=3031114 RepID=UPI0023F6EECA|nr:hypothetical protein [Spongiactinospora sp. TRM90649]MDF5751764.1 hypothetical protein [Spongiactinospora sp. TRM90649]